MADRRSESATPAGMQQRGPTFGEELRRERELRQISLREVAEATKINLRFLEALERNEFEHLPGGVFNRGFVRAYAEHIGVDPDAMVNAYLLEERAGNGEPVPSDGKMMEAYRSVVRIRATANGEDRIPWLKWVAVAIGMVLLLAAGALLYFKFGPSATEASANQAAPPAAAPKISQPVTDPETGPSTAPAQDEPKTDGSAATNPSGEPQAVPAPLPAAGSREHEPIVSATIFIDRPVAGRLNCDNRQIEVLDGMRPGARLGLACESYLIVDASDAGALRIALRGRETVPLGPDGQSLSSHRIEIPASSGEDAP